MRFFTDRLNLVWLALMLATVLTWALGASGWVGRSGLAGIAVVFALAWAKGVAVVLDFMELRHAPPLWRRVIIATLTLIVALILLAYFIGMKR